MPATSGHKSNVSPFKVGERVRFLWGPQKVEATVIEDRGHVGSGGRQIYRVELRLDAYESMAFEMPAEELEKVI